MSEEFIAEQAIEYETVSSDYYDLMLRYFGWPPYSKRVHLRIVDVRNDGSNPVFDLA